MNHFLYTNKYVKNNITIFTIYTVCVSQKVQPLRNTVQIIYAFVQIYKLVSPRTSKNFSWIWWWLIPRLVHSWLVVQWPYNASLRFTSAAGLVRLKFLVPPVPKRWFLVRCGRRNHFPNPQDCRRSKAALPRWLWPALGRVRDRSLNSNQLKPKKNRRNTKREFVILQSQGTFFFHPRTFGRIYLLEVHA